MATIYFWLITPRLEPKTWTEDNTNYLLFRLQGKKDENVFLCFPPRDAPLLIIPEDDSPVINQIKTRQQYDYFATSFDNLKLKRDFLKVNMFGENQLVSGLLIKDNNKLEKVSESVPVFPEITFKVVKQRKEGYGQGNKRRPLTYEESFSQHGAYKHVLEIESLDLGIEGVPPIMKIIFEFAEPTQPTDYKALTKSKWYKSNILTKSVGKKFNMKVKSWNWKAGFDTLTFHDNWDFEWDSFQERSTDNNSASPEKGNKELIIGGAMIIIAVFSLIIGFLVIKKKKNK